MPIEEGVTSSRICPYCKRPVNADWKVCPYCGETLRLPSRSEWKICQNCRTLIKEELRICPHCGRDPSQPPTYEYRSAEYYYQPSSAWYLAPLLFAILGGIIGYLGVKDDDKDMANNMLILGMVMSFIYALIGWAWVYSLLH
jgi:RNA polymerase subunit RPABC4/transcription elongation factor Spt4